MVEVCGLQLIKSISLWKTKVWICTSEINYISLMQQLHTIINFHKKTIDSCLIYNQFSLYIEVLFLFWAKPFLYTTSDEFSWLKSPHCLSSFWYKINIFDLLLSNLNNTRLQCFFFSKTWPLNSFHKLRKLVHCNVTYQLNLVTLNKHKND